MIEMLQKKEVVKKVNWGDFIEQGTIIRQVGKNKDNQGIFSDYGDDGSIILLNVINMNKAEYAVDAGVVKPKKSEKIFKYKSKFDNSPMAFDALETVKNWTLFTKHPEIQKDILEFVKSSFVPELIKYWKKTDQMYRLFVPIQQKFEIGRFKKEKTWDDFLKDNFKQRLNDLSKGAHITYLGNIPNQKLFKTHFYSIGTETHVETNKQLQKEPFIFCATHGGHIKYIEDIGKKKHFIVDAGSNLTGKGVDTDLRMVNPIVEALSKEYPDFMFSAVPGREAFGYASCF